jgi:hypothetical protein
MYHFGNFKNFKHYYLHFICVHLQRDFPKALSYSRFIQLLPRCFMPVMFFLNLVCFGKCTGITFVDSTKIAVCHNKRIFNHKVFREIAKRGKSTAGFMASNGILSVMIKVGFSPSVLHRETLAAETQNH